MSEDEKMVTNKEDKVEIEAGVSEQAEKKDIPYLPIGSVVLLKEGKKRVMVYGRKMKSRDDNKEYDYIGCLYPEGYLSSDDVILFDHNQIQLVYFIGFQDLEEIVYRTNKL